MHRFLLHCCSVGLLLTLFFACQTAETPQQPPNVLFIAVDDLRPQLGCYGNDIIQSPNIDQLASEGFLFEHAYCNVPVCGASRASLLTGLRPKPDRFLNYYTYANEDAPEATSLPEHFKNNGYYTASLGKVFHNRDDKPNSWSEPAWHPSVDMPEGGSWRDYQLPENIELDNSGDTRGPPYENVNLPDSTYFDGKIANRAKLKLQQFSGQEQPFFLAVGFVKPHLPFNAPRKYWDLYEEAEVQPGQEIPFPENAPEQARHNFGELRHYALIPEKGPVPDSIARKLIHGYHACVSYTDALIGQVLEELERLDLAENTVVILWGDHGWSLQEHGLWCKHSTFNVAMQTPLILKVPGKSGGQRIEALAEFVDIYPSLCELADLPFPEHLQGDSFVPLLENPEADGKEAVFARWHSADAVKTERYLYTEWFDSTSNSVARMLYDHQTDQAETVNIAEEEEHTALVQELSQMVRAQRQ